MQVAIDTTLFNKVPSFKIGIIHYNKITVDSSPQMIKGRMQLYQENLFFDLQDQKVTDIAGIKEWRAVLKQFGADPNRYRPSHENLLRRIAKQHYLEPLQSAVDLNNFFSLQYEIPVGIYDYEQLSGGINITLGTEQTNYDGLNGRTVTLKNLPYSQDEAGAFGSLYVDSKRTATSLTTTEALQIFYLKPSMGTEEAMKLLTSASHMFTQICGGTSSCSILHAQKPILAI